MIDHVEELAQLCRQNGMPVATGDVLVAVRALVAVGLERRDDAEHALGAALVKRASDRPLFHELFGLVFLRGGELARALASDAPLADRLRALGLDDDAIERVLAVLADQAASLSTLARSLLGLREADVAQLLRATGAAADRAGLRMVSPLQVGWQTHRLLDALGQDAADREIARVLTTLREALGADAAEVVAKASQAEAVALRRAMRAWVQAEYERQNLAELRRWRGRTLADKRLGDLTPAELMALRAEVRRLCEKLRTHARVRPRRRRGRLDLRRTLRASLATGGRPFRLIWKRRRPDRPRLVILCDVSDSVRNVTRFLLELVYTIQELFARVRSFVFVADVGETTDLFRAHDLPRAVELAYGGAVVSVNQNSNYGRALEEFERRFADAVTSKTTLIVLGDGRTNYAPPNVERLASLRRRARRVLWITPEPPAAWGFGDSAMRAYETACDRVAVAYNLSSLAAVLDELVL